MNYDNLYYELKALHNLLGRILAKIEVKQA